MFRLVWHKSSHYSWWGPDQLVHSLLAQRYRIHSQHDLGPLPNPIRLLLAPCFLWSLRHLLHLAGSLRCRDCDWRLPLLWRRRTLCQEIGPTNRPTQRLFYVWRCRWNDAGHIHLSVRPLLLLWLLPRRPAPDRYRPRHGQEVNGLNMEKFFSLRSFYFPKQVILDSRSLQKLYQNINRSLYKLLHIFIRVLKASKSAYKNLSERYVYSKRGLNSPAELIIIKDLILYYESPK